MRYEDIETAEHCAKCDDYYCGHRGYRDDCKEGKRMSMGTRIKELRKSLDLTQQKFADRLGVKRNTVAQWEVDINPLTDAMANLICREFRVNEAWLRDGIGEMFIEQTRDEEIAAFVGKIQENPDDTFKKQMISVLAHLTEDQWVFLEQKAKELVGEKEKD